MWIYDGRTNVPHITKKDRPLTPEHFAEFEECYGDDPNGLATRTDETSPNGDGWRGGNRWRQFSIEEIRHREFNIDGLKWLRDESLGDADELPPPEELATDAISELESAIGELNAILDMLEGDSGDNSAGFDASV
jgi:type I restriction enzyme M protein